MDQLGGPHSPEIRMDYREYRNPAEAKAGGAGNPRWYAWGLLAVVVAFLVWVFV